MINVILKYCGLAPARFSIFTKELSGTDRYLPLQLHDKPTTNSEETSQFITKICFEQRSMTNAKLFCAIQPCAVKPNLISDSSPSHLLSTYF